MRVLSEGQAGNFDIHILLHTHTERFSFNLLYSFHLADDGFARSVTTPSFIISK